MGRYSTVQYLICLVVVEGGIQYSTFLHRIPGQGFSRKCHIPQSCTQDTLVLSLCVCDTAEEVELRRYYASLFSVVSSPQPEVDPPGACLSIQELDEVRLIGFGLHTRFMNITHPQLIWGTHITMLLSHTPFIHTHRHIVFISSWCLFADSWRRCG